MKIIGQNSRVGLHFVLNHEESEYRLQSTDSGKVGRVCSVYIFPCVPENIKLESTETDRGIIHNQMIATPPKKKKHSP